MSPSSSQTPTVGLILRIWNSVLGTLLAQSDACFLVSPEQLLPVSVGSALI